MFYDWYYNNHVEGISQLNSNKLVSHWQLTIRQMFISYANA